MYPKTSSPRVSKLVVWRVPAKAVMNSQVEDIEKKEEEEIKIPHQILFPMV